MNLFSEFLQVVREAVSAVAAEQGISAELDMSRITAEPPRDSGTATSRPMPRWY